MTLKKCSCCAAVKPVSEFTRAYGERTNDGLYDKCNDCRYDQSVEKYAAAYLRNRVKFIEKNKRFRVRYGGYWKEYYKKNRVSVLRCNNSNNYRYRRLIVPGEQVVVLPSRDMSRGQCNRRW